MTRKTFVFAAVQDPGFKLQECISKQSEHGSWKNVSTVKTASWSKNINTTEDKLRNFHLVKDCDPL